MLQKVIKKIEALFELYEEQQSADLTLKMIKMQFVTVHILNKIKIKQSIAVIEPTELNIKDRLVIFYANERANELDSIEILEESNAEDEYDTFSKWCLM